MLKIQEDIKVCLAESHLDQVKILGLKNSLLEKVEKLSDIDEQVLTGLEPANIEADVVESMTFLDPIHELLAEITLKTESIKLNSLTSRSTKGSSENCKLPKLELPIFKGSPLEWQGFWDQFEVSIHRNESISDIDRFNYLKRYLSGQDLSTISGLTLNAENYMEAITT